MDKIRSRSVVIPVVACFAACISGCSPREGRQNRAGQENSVAPPIDTGLNKNQERTLRLSIRGFASTSGNCRIAVYSNSASFNQPEKAALRAILPIEGEVAVWEPFEEEMIKLPGEVAIAAFQDVNENEKLDKNSLGIPTERYGFSNNPKRGFGPPSFQQAKFNLSTGINTLDIEIR